MWSELNLGTVFENHPKSRILPFFGNTKNEENRPCFVNKMGRILVNSAVEWVNFGKSKQKQKARLFEYLAVSRKIL